jgi:Flp pilus assembly protein TadD
MRAHFLAKSSRVFFNPHLDRATAIVFTAFVAIASTGPGLAADADKSSNAGAAQEISEAARKAYADSMQHARALLSQKKYDDAIAQLDKLSAERPREPQARFLKAVALADQKKTDDAIAVYRGLVADFPEMPEPHNNLAALYAQKGELALARDELMLALSTAPDYALAHENLGDVYTQLAAEQYQRAADLDKRSKTASAKLKTVREVIQAAP